jgi:hypothetical protein
MTSSGASMADMSAWLKISSAVPTHCPLDGPWKSVSLVPASLISVLGKKLWNGTSAGAG